jgi:hypothetical protein
MSTPLPVISLMSPLGLTFAPKWKANPRSFEKSVQRDKFPLIQGEYGADLGGGADQYSFTLLFDGIGQDTLADMFFEACKQIGTWQVVHPVHGYIELQLLRVEQRVDPTDSGGLTEIQTEWMEPLNLVTLMTTRAMAGVIDDLMASTAATSASGFADSIGDQGFSGIGSVINAVNLCNGAAEKAAEIAFYSSASADAKATARAQSEDAQDSLADSIDSAASGPTGFDPGEIATQLHAVIQAPILACPDVKTALKTMDTIADTFIGLIPAGHSTADFGRAHVSEVALEACVCAGCLASTLGSISTRVQAIGAAQSLADLFAKSTDAMDAVQEQFEDNPRADRRYYAQTETYQATLAMVAKTIEYLIIRSFDLAIEKTVVLDRDKTPIQICVEEFGAQGEDRLDDLIEWNQLEGDDVELLGGGRSIVVYVEAA